MKSTILFSSLISFVVTSLVAASPIAANKKIHVRVYNASDKCICDHMLSCRATRTIPLVIQAIGKDLDQNKHQAAWRSIAPNQNASIPSNTGAVSIRKKRGTATFSVPSNSGYSNFTALLMADTIDGKQKNAVQDYFLMLMPSSFIDTKTCKVKSPSIDFINARSYYHVEQTE